MNIRIIINENNNELVDIMNKIKKQFFQYKEYRKYNLVFNNKKSKYDLYLLLLNGTEDLKDISKHIKLKYKIIIITNNFSSSNINNCIKLTNNLIYANTKIENILFKIISIYENNKYINSKNKN